jgi:Kae1-associated kinase Bud32
MEELIRRGAEAEIYRSTYMGQNVIIKRRTRKTYRIQEIDEELRRQRTKKEAVLITEARKAGVSVPIIYDVDLHNMEITMGYVDGIRIKDYLDTMKSAMQQALCRTIGRSIAHLHESGIIHGDITTSNLIYADDSIYFIDFGLGEKSRDIEKKGVDLHLLMEALKAAHLKKGLFDWVTGEYQKLACDAQLVLKKVHDIGKRGRYMVKE